MTQTGSATGAGTREQPWTLTTPPGKSQFSAYRDPEAHPPALVVRAGSTELRYHLRCIEDLHEMLRGAGDWVVLGNADEGEAGRRRRRRGVGPQRTEPGWGLVRAQAGNLPRRFAMYVPPVLEVFGLAEVEHNARNNRMRAL